MIHTSDVMCDLFFPMKCVCCVCFFLSADSIDSFSTHLFCRLLYVLLPLFLRLFFFSSIIYFKNIYMNNLKQQQNPNDTHTYWRIHNTIEWRERRRMSHNFVALLGVLCVSCWYFYCCRICCFCSCCCCSYFVSAECVLCI